MTESMFRNERAKASQWFSEFQSAVASRFERLEAEQWDALDRIGEAPRFETAASAAKADDGADRGGGVMSQLTGGCLFEKVGVNASTVFGVLTETSLRRLAAGKTIAGLERDPRFWASGISLVAHMRNPNVPAVHFNTRMFWTPVRWWFGGAADLNPCIGFAEDTAWFHRVLEECCERTCPGRYAEYRKWADDYFHIPHRGRPRGVGGIFFDGLNSGDWEADFRFVKDVGRAFLKAFIPIVYRRCREPWSEDDRETQLIHRGHYAEFNLIYDRGTRFGLESGHDPKAVLMSLPPLAKWP